MEESGAKVALSTKHHTKTPDNTCSIQACGKLLSPLTKETKVFFYLERILKRNLSRSRPLTVTSLLIVHTLLICTFLYTYVIYWQYKLHINIYKLGILYNIVDRLLWRHLCATEWKNGTMGCWIDDTDLINHRKINVT